MRIAICDDHKEDQRELCTYCSNYAIEHQLTFQINTFVSGEELLESDYFLDHDLIFLDIYMKKLTGIDTAKNLRARGYNGAIVFTTISDDFYADGFDLAAIHYLLKPIVYKKLSTALTRVVQTLDPPETCIHIMSNRMPATISIKNIIYVEAYGHDIIIHTIEGPLKVNIPLNKLSRELPTPPFLRCYRSYIVNMDFIQNVSEDQFIVKNGSCIPLTKKYRIRIRSTYMSYILGKTSVSLRAGDGA